MNYSLSYMLERKDCSSASTISESLHGMNVLSCSTFNIPSPYLLASMVSDDISFADIYPYSVSIIPTTIP